MPGILGTRSKPGLGLALTGLVGLGRLLAAPWRTASPRVHARTIQIEGLQIFYREAGPRWAPTLLLLHGFPTSSHMFRDLIPLLATRYHVVAPDYPGFGYSDRPDVAAFEYSFANSDARWTVIPTQGGH